MNIFERAIRNKLRFPSNKGELTTEQLFDVPLRSTNGFNLDSVARSINSRLKESQATSFVDTEAADDKLQLQMDVVLAVIDDKKRREAAAEKAAATLAQKKLYEQALAKKKLEEIESMSAEELEALIGEAEEEL